MKKIRLLLFLFIFLGISANYLKGQTITYPSWHKMYNDTMQGINMNEALHFLQVKKLKPQQQIIVGIIDSGIDTTSIDLIPALWHNSKERIDGKDNDKNGYVDDIHGWNFLGTKDGSFSMTSAGTEEYREFKRLYPIYKNVKPETIQDTTEYAYYEMMKKKAGIMSYIKFVNYTAIKDKAYQLIDSVLATTPGMNIDTLTINGFIHLPIENETWNNACQTLYADFLKKGKQTLWKDVHQEHRNAFALMLKRLDGIEHDTDKRLLMGDNLKDSSDRFYGNPLLQAEGCEHGTFVAGVIAGQGINDHTITGVWPQARLMIIRAVPDGDEYDKDISSSIRYAADNGAKVINMSLGKYTSPDAAMVNDAIAYALKKDVLIIQAAGNNKRNIDHTTYFPSAKDSKGKTFANYLRVGSSNKKGQPSEFSNYGIKEVDVYAPGEEITSVTVGNKYMVSQGTSIATPVVSGVAAMLRAYFPKLTATQIKEILIKSVRPVSELKDRCTSGGIIDALQAVKLATEYNIYIQAQGSSAPFNNVVEEADWTRAEKFSADSLNQYVKGKRPYPTWVEGSSYFYYNVKEDNGILYYLVNAKNGKKRVMIKDNEQFVRQYAKIIGDTLDGSNMQLHGFRFKKNDFNRFYLDKKGKSIMYDMQTGMLTQVKPENKRQERPIIRQAYHSTDSLFTMLGCGYDLYIRDNRTGNVRRLTKDGKENASYTYRCTKDTIEANSRGFWLGHRYIYLMQDMSEVKEISLINSLAHQRPTTKTFKMPMPGDAGVRQYRLYWYDADHEQGKMLPIDKYPDQVVVLDHFRSPETLFLTRRSRKADKIDLCRINLIDGTITELISEECTPHINLTLSGYRIVEKGKYFIWWSERTGKGNYYLYNSNGQLLNRITQGDNLVAGHIVHVDTLQRNIIFAGYGQEPGINPYYTFYYKASLDGKRQILLTPGNGNHELTLSDDRRYAIDQYSRMDLVPVMNVLSIDHPTRRFEVARMDDSQLRRAGWQPPVLLKLKAADGKTDLYGLMYLPSQLDKTKKYPIISNVYPGPQDDQIPQSFTLDDNGNQSLAELGFIVINVAPRGSSPLRGHAFYNFGYGNLRDYPLADDRNVINQLAHEYPFIDLDRVGIYGHSGGAFQAVAAILTYPDFYKVAIAASGNHDNNIYIQWWGETFHGLTEKTDPKTGKTVFSTKIPTNMELAGNLKGRLMLITGDVDKNVPPSSTYRLADALIKANKRFDMFILPGKDHGIMCPYYQNLIRYYFVENLIQPIKRHIDIINHN